MRLREQTGQGMTRPTLKAGPLQAMRMVHDVCREFEQAVALDPNNVEAPSDLLEFYLGAPPSYGGSTRPRRRSTLLRNWIRRWASAPARSSRKSSKMKLGVPCRGMSN